MEKIYHNFLPNFLSTFPMGTADVPEGKTVAWCAVQRKGTHHATVEVSIIGAGPVEARYTVHFPRYRAPYVAPSGDFPRENEHLALAQDWAYGVTGSNSMYGEEDD